MILGALKCWAHNFFRVIKLLVKIIWPPKNCGLKKSFWSEKDFWFKKFWSTEIKALKKLGPKSLVKVGSVTAEILGSILGSKLGLIWGFNIGSNIGFNILLNIGVSMLGSILGSIFG